jgi:hypothetical protein
MASQILKYCILKTDMEFRYYLFLFLPVLVAFLVLYYLDDYLKRQVGNRMVVALIEVLIALLILFFGLGLAFSILA